MLLLVFCGCKNTNDFLTVQYFFNYFIDNQHYSRKKSFFKNSIIRQ